MRTTGFCHLLLQSRAPVPRSLSMRSRLARTESFRFRTCRPPWRSCLPSDERSSTQRFHAAEVALVDRRCLRLLLARPWWLVVPPRSPSTDPVSCQSRRVDAPACESLRSGSRIEAAPRSFVGGTREGLTTARSDTTSVERCISSTDALRRLSRMEWHMVRLHTSPLGSPGFAASGTSHYASSPLRCRAALGKHGCLG